MQKPVVRESQKRRAGLARSRPDVAGDSSRPAPSRNRMVARPAAAVLVTLLIVVISGCATIGRSFPPERVAEVRIGETSKAELLGYFGLPYRRGIEDGDSTWTYVHYKVKLFGEKMRTRDLYLRFDDRGIVRSFTYNSNMQDG